MKTLARHDLVHRDGRRLYVYGELRGSLQDDDVPILEPPALQQRFDQLTGAWVAVSPTRNTRPYARADESADGRCPLCPGGPEVPFGYEAAVFENRFPSFMAEPPEVAAHPLVAPSFGYCEVVLYTDAHTGSLATLTPKELARVIAIWRDRSEELWADPRHRFVLIFENRGEEIGATLSHPHGQIYAFDHLPPIIAERVEALAHHRAETGRCLGCDIDQADSAATERVLAATGSFLVAVPFAARWPYEVHVRARRHGLRRLGDLQPGEALDLARALRDVVLRYDGLFGFELPYMMVAHEAPAGAEDWHLSFEFFPPHRGADKLKIRASVETATGLFINDMLPESSAAELAAVPVAVTRGDDEEVPRVRRQAERSVSRT